MELTPRRRRAISTLLAVLLAVESVSVVAAAAGTATLPHATTHALPAASPDGLVLAEAGTASEAGEPAVATPTPSPTVTPAPVATPAPTAAPVATPKATPKPKAAPKPKAIVPAKTKAPAAPVRVTHAKPPTSASVYAGRNHVWIPSLGVNRSVSAFACTRTRPPDNYVYRWGCAGTNNVYLLGHASGVFQPLHDAYLNGRLKVGMRVWYADGGGAVHQYAVRWWRLTPPTTDGSWAWAAQGVPSMTLQTCIGANSQYRLIVRLVQVGG
jgi:Sortase domain